MASWTWLVSVGSAHGTSRHSVLPMRSAPVPVGRPPGVPGCSVLPPFPMGVAVPVNGSSLMYAAWGLPSWTSDSCAPTSSNANAYALPFAICWCASFAYTFVRASW
ncbi:Uncharacterised protein [Mycobacteroides abscessus]|nr:Uncharacterised protein [Mycobacteroides abscessus]